ncbi:hypothetical protein RHS01_11395, partial [Rhizoctonia solani]
MAILFFRRVRPVETRIYAFTRNSFAVAAMVILIFQLMTALRQAQNEIRARETSETCFLASRMHRLMVLSVRALDRVRWDLPRENATQDDINITISAILNNPNKPYRPYTMTSCNVTWVDSYSAPLKNGTAHKVSELFNCPSSLINPVDGLTYSLSMSPSMGNIIDKELSYTYRVQLQLAGKVPGELNWSDTTQVRELTRIREYSLPLVLLPGSHITSEANLITRRFITSSIVREILFNSKPVYKHLSLYPIAQLSATPLNVSDARVATADIRITLNPGHMQYRTGIDFLSFPSNLRKDVCDFIEDYRSGTVLDVIGSVGGLFALLQAAHLLLFGRPLFWGLAGGDYQPVWAAGRCSSRNFKRRLREEYHTQSDEENNHPCESSASSVKAESHEGDEDEPNSE